MDLHINPHCQRNFRKNRSFNSTHHFNFADSGQKSLFFSIFLCRADEEAFQSSIVAGSKVVIPLKSIQSEKGFSIHLSSSNDTQTLASLVFVKIQYLLPASRNGMHSPQKDNTFTELFPVQENIFFSSNPFQSLKVLDSSLKTKTQGSKKSSQNEIESVLSDEDLDLEIPKLSHHEDLKCDESGSFSDIQDSPHNSAVKPTTGQEHSMIYKKKDSQRDSTKFSIHNLQNRHPLPPLDMKQVGSTFPPLDKRQNVPSSQAVPSLKHPNQFKNPSCIHPLLKPKQRYFSAIGTENNQTHVHQMLQPTSIFKKPQI